REGSGMDRVVPGTVPGQVQEDAEPETEGRRDPPATVAAVQRHPGPHGDHVHPGDACILALGPLAEGEIVDLVTIGGEPLGQVPVPALGAADGVRIDAVVDDADPHGGESLALWPTGPAAATGLNFPPLLHDTNREMAIHPASRAPRRFTATALRVSVVI